MSASHRVIPPEARPLASTRATTCTLLAALACACGSAPRGTTAASVATEPGDPLLLTSAEALYAEGVRFAERGALVKAEQYLSASLVRGYPEEQVMPLLLRVCLISSRYSLALRHGERYLRRHPDNWSLRYLMASLHNTMGDRARAIEQLRAVVEVAPERPEPRYLLATLLHDDGEAEAASPHLQRYLELAPFGPHAEDVRRLLAEAGAD